MAALPRVKPSSGFSLLNGIRVLDLTTSIAGPYAGMLLADLGAEVIKIERPGKGDDARAWGPPFLDGESLWFLSVNRNKKSVTLDYASDQGRAVLGDLVGQSDVVLVNQPPRVQRKLGADWETLRSRRDDLVFVSITGFGLTGYRADWTCYDLIAEGYSGVMDLTGEPDGPAQKVGTPAADMLAGQDAALAAVAALFDRARTGSGHLIDISLVDSMTRFLTCRIVPYLGSGEAPTRSGGRDSVIAIYQAFDTSDLPMTLGLGTDAIWRRFWQAVGRPEYCDNKNLDSNADRRSSRARIVADIQQILLTRPRDHWLETMAGAGVPAGPINRVSDVVADPQLLRRGLFYCLETDGRSLPQVGLGVVLDGQASSPTLPPPTLGAHTKEVLRTLLNYSEPCIRALAAANVI